MSRDHFLLIFFTGHKQSFPTRLCHWKKPVTWKLCMTIFLCRKVRINFTSCMSSPIINSLTVSQRVHMIFLWKLWSRDSGDFGKYQTTAPEAGKSISADLKLLYLPGWRSLVWSQEGFWPPNFCRKHNLWSLCFDGRFKIEFYFIVSMEKRKVKTSPFVIILDF